MWPLKRAAKTSPQFGELETLIDQPPSTALAKLDGLVLVHPDYSKPSEVYSSNILAALDFVRNSGMPLFFVRSSYFGYGSVEKMALAQGGIEIKPDSRQKEVCFIANKIGKTPRDTSLGFGGMYAECCVLQHAKYWCKTIFATTYKEAELPDHYFAPIGCGVILNPLSMPAPFKLS
ncbi:hypothetical protein HYU11_03875 [Candidatus Woesearchaeota archaeon]|nr:hypothetical protein [Candidatus Woesearchaeota archaeon]